MFLAASRRLHTTDRTIVLTTLTGIVLLLLGLGHAVIYAMIGGAWDGPISLRKPILFGVSSGVTILSLAWVFDHFTNKAISRWLLVSAGVALICEVGLITWQYWRGQPSHFYADTAFDAAVIASIEGLIVWVLLVICYGTWCVHFSNSDTLRSDQQAAARGGMRLLLAGCLLGALITVIGYQQLHNGLSPEIFGKQGVLKFPHGIPLHAVQILPFTAWLATFGRCTLTSRTRGIHWLECSLWAFTLYGLVQTFSGNARTTVEWTSVPFLVLAALSGVWAFWRLFGNSLKPEALAPEKASEMTRN